MNPDDVRREWAERSGEYSPEYYAYYGPNETSEEVRRILDRFVGSDASVLELGCSSGRHLSELHEHGFDELAGVDINEDAFDVMADAYPSLEAAGTFYCDAIEEVVGAFDDGQFDAVYSVETIQHVHPDDAWVFDELARIADDLLVTVENEGDSATKGSPGEDVNYVRDDVPLYYRDWNRVFTELGFVEVEATSTDRNTVRAFRGEEN